MIKKIFLGLGILFGLLLIAVIAIPVIYKDDIVQLIKTEANNNLNAELDFGEFDLSMIKTFPNLYFEINDLKVTNKAPFEGTELASIKSFNFTIDIMSVISGDAIQIRAINIIDPTFNVKVLEDGKANWDIAMASSDTTVTTAEPVDTSASAFKLGLKKLSIVNANILYEDKSLPMFTELKNMNYEMSGDFTETVFNLNNKLGIESFTLDFDGVRYLKNVNTSFTAEFAIDMDSAKYQFLRNELKMNELILGFEGWLAMPGDDIDMDINFQTNKPSFATILSLIPGAYTADFKNVETKGELTLGGYAKGIYNDNRMPAFGLNLAIEEAMFKYPDLPMPVENIALMLFINNPDGDLDHTVVDIPNFHFELAKEIFDLHLSTRTPMSDPYIDFGAVGKMHLEYLTKAFPIDGVEKLTGLMDMDLQAKGNLSTIEKERYEDFNTSGHLDITNMHYVSVDLPNEMVLQKLSMNFNPRNVTLNALNVVIGKSDLQMNGAIDNFIAYALADSVLKGSMNIYSNVFDANEWLEEETTTDGTTTENVVDTSSLEVAEVPKNIDFVITADMKKLLYDNMEITNIKGNIIVRDGIAKLTNTTMNMLGGDIAMSGTYHTLDAEKPYYDFIMDLKNMDIQKSAVTFNTIEEYAPVAKASQGTFATHMSIAGYLGKDMYPIYETMSGKGTLNVRNMVVQGFPITDKIGDALKYEEIKRLKADKFDANFEIKDSRIYLEPFDITANGLKMNIGGSNGLDETIDYKIKTAFPRNKLGGTTQAVDGLLSSLGKGAIKAGENINIDMTVTGTMSDPKIGFGVNDLAKNIKEDIKDKAKEEIDKLKNQAKDELDAKKKEAEEKARAEARAKADQIIKEAEQKAATVRAEGKKLADQIRAEGEANAKKIEAEAKNPLQKTAAKVAADKIRAESKDKAAKVESEANTKANNIVTEAKKQADALVK